MTGPPEAGLMLISGRRSPPFEHVSNAPTKAEEEEGKCAETSIPEVTYESQILYEPDYFRVHREDRDA